MITNDQFREMEARVAPKVADKRTPNAVDLEKDLHEQIETICKAKGYLVRHDRMGRKTTGQIGWPDYEIFMPNKRFCALELKAKGNKASEEQLATIAWFHKFKFTAEIVDNLPDAIRVMESTKPEAEIK
jgi:hypothetical protein